MRFVTWFSVLAACDGPPADAGSPGLTDGPNLATGEGAAEGTLAWVAEQALDVARRDWADDALTASTVCRVDPGSGLAQPSIGTCGTFLSSATTPGAALLCWDLGQTCDAWESDALSDHGITDWYLDSPALFEQLDVTEEVYVHAIGASVAREVGDLFGAYWDPTASPVPDDVPAGHAALLVYSLWTEDAPHQLLAAVDGATGEVWYDARED